MEKENLQYLKSKINERINRFTKRRDCYRKKSLYIFLIISILSAVTSVVLGLNISGCEETLRIIALIISGIVTVVSAYNAFFDNKQMWINYNNTLNEFYKLNFEIEFAEKSNAINEEMILKFKKDYQTILGKFNSQWTDLRKKEN